MKSQIGQAVSRESMIKRKKGMSLRRSISELNPQTEKEKKEQLFVKCFLALTQARAEQVLVLFSEKKSFQSWLSLVNFHISCLDSNLRWSLGLAEAHGTPQGNGLAHVLAADRAA